MTLNIIIGAQWGDEGKGRITDLIASESDIVARYNGGDNAGHTVTVGKQVFKLHLIPSGITHAHTVCVLGIGMVINPLSLLDELEHFRRAGIKIESQRLMISHLAHLITPAHRYLDKVQEEARGKGNLGTTGRGIGPAYMDKVQRSGIRALEILDPTSLREKVCAQMAYASQFAIRMYDKPALDVEAVADEYVQRACELSPFVVDVAAFLRHALQEGKKVLAEGAQGTLLDIDYGTYPFVTSSSTLACGALAGLGIGLFQPERVIGVAKAFQTRVGSGPFPTEIKDDFAIRLRGTGENPWDEFGATTGRPRRVGWHDAALLRYAVEVNGLTELALTKLDILSGIPVLRLCSTYRSKKSGNTATTIPVSDLEAYEPVYEDLPGWQADISSARTWSELPKEAQSYVNRITEISGAPVNLISVGPERNQVIRR